LNYENAVFLFDSNCIKDIRKDFDEMLEKSVAMEERFKKKVSIWRKMWWAILKCFSPMF
jgi:hypothetical protein